MTTPKRALAKMRAGWFARRCRHQWRLDVPGWVCELCGAETLMPEGFAVERDTETET